MHKWDEQMGNLGEKQVSLLNEIIVMEMDCVCVCDAAKIKIIIYYMEWPHNDRYVSSIVYIFTNSASSFMLMSIWFAVIAFCISSNHHHSMVIT